MTQAKIWASEDKRELSDSNDPASSSSSCDSQNSHESGNKVVDASEILSRRNPQYDEEEELLSKSCEDLLQNAKEKRSFPRSKSCISIPVNQLGRKGKFDHVESKVKQYIDSIHTADTDVKLKPTPKPAESSNEEYLQEINIRLSRELEEKNAILQQLQENYEHLLLKYAEAQNKIDNLRLKSVSDPKDNSNKDVAPAKSYRKQIVAPSVYPFKSAELCGMGMSTLTVGGGISDRENRIDRPSTLAVDSSLRFNEKDGLKAVTPTDSEGVSSVITSMSGHSKILTNLEDTPKDMDDNAILKSEVLDNAIPVNDSFDKVKNWQNSLPPLDMIETPDTALYDLEASTPSTRYNDFPAPELSGIPENSTKWPQQDVKPVSQAIMKKYLRTLSLPSSLTRRNMLAQIYKRRSNHTIDLSSPLRVDCSNSFAGIRDPKISPPSRKISAPNNISLIQKRKKRQPFLRSASLPTYDLESPPLCPRNNVPPLDLDNLTLSEDDSSPINKSNLISSPSFLTSHDCSFQTLGSLNSCKATASESSTASFTNQIIHKSTSITPDRSKEMISFDVRETTNASQSECCNVCGETVSELQRGSYQCNNQRGVKTGFTGNMAVHRSVSFTSGSSSPSPILQGITSDEGVVDSFDAYASNLKARSQVIMKALTAHVKNN